MTIVVAIFLALGLFFFLAGAIGVIRFPDFYSRLHPAGMLDTMGLLLSMTGLALYTLFCSDHDHGATLATFLTSLKIILIVIFVYITSPTATHAIVDAGMRAGLKPWTKETKEDN